MVYESINGKIIRIDDFWKDGEIQEMFKGWGGGVGNHLYKSGDELIRYLIYADKRNLEKVINGLVSFENYNVDEVDNFLTWVWNDIPIFLVGWVGALIIVGVDIHKIMNTYNG